MREVRDVSKTADLMMVVTIPSKDPERDPLHGATDGLRPAQQIVATTVRIR